MAGPADGGHDPQLLDTLESFEPQPYDGQAWRVTFDGQEPLRPNIRGARWNPKDVSALYMSTSAECVRAEFQHLIDLQPSRPDPSATEYTFNVKLTSVLDLTDRTRLHALGLNLDALDDDSLTGFPPFQRVGGAASFPGIEGLLVPSVRLAGGVNLVIFTDNVQFNGVSEISKAAEQPFGVSPSG